MKRLELDVAVAVGAAVEGFLKKSNPAAPVVAVVPPNMPWLVVAGPAEAGAWPKRDGAAGCDVEAEEEAENMLDLDLASVVELGSKIDLRLAVGSSDEGMSRLRLVNRLLLPGPVVLAVEPGLLNMDMSRTAHL